MKHFVHLQEVLQQDHPLIYYFQFVVLYSQVVVVKSHPNLNDNLLFLHLSQQFPFVNHIFHFVIGHNFLVLSRHYKYDNQ